MKRFLAVLLIIFSALSLTQCSLFSPVPSQDETLYEINVPTCARDAHKIPAKIYLAPMQVYPGLNTSRMRYTVKDHQVDYFTKNRWVAPPNSMLQALLLANLQSLYRQATLLDDGSEDYRLNTTLSEFEQVFYCGCSEFHFAMRVELLDQENQRVIFNRTFRYIEPANPAAPYGGVMAANRATERFLHDLDKVLRH